MAVRLLGFNMSEAPQQRVFISYTSSDRSWAEWIAWQIEAQGYRAVIQAWDFRPGSNFVLEMQKAAEDSAITIAILSSAYLAAKFTQPEWAAAFRVDPQGENHSLIPVRVEFCEPQGLLGPIVYVDLVGVDEPTARTRLLGALVKGRAKPVLAPAFPGGEADESERAKPLYPGIVGHLWNVPSRNAFFVGREALIVGLREQLIQSQHAILSGLPGIGKTQAAIAYAQHYRQRYSAGFFLRANTDATIISGFGELAKLLTLAERDSQDQTLTVGAVQRWLRDKTGWLLIADNADDLGLVREFLPSEIVGGHLLLTSRESATRVFAPPTEVRPMEEATGARLLLSRAGFLKGKTSLETVSAELLTAARELNRELGGLPLALEQAAAYMEEMAQTPIEYLTLYKLEENARRLRAWQSSVVAPEHDSVAVTFNLAFQQVARTSRAAVDLLRLCAFLASDDIPELLLTCSKSVLPDPLAAAVADDITRAQIIRASSRFSLIHRDSSAKSLSLHRQVGAVLRDRLAEEKSDSWLRVAILAVAACFPDSLVFSNWPVCEALLPHGLSCAKLISEKNIDIPEAAILLQRAANYLHLRARYAEAEPLYEDALRIRKLLVESEDHPDVASVLNDLGLLYFDDGRLVEAERSIRRALDIRERHLDPEHKEIGTSLNNLGSLYSDQGRTTEAEPLMLRAVSIREKAFGSENPETAAAMNNLAAVYQRQHRLPEAQRLYERALEIRQKCFGLLHPATANSLGNLSEFYREQGHLDKAEIFNQKALVLREKLLGPEHPDIATNLGNLGSLYDFQGRFSEAEPLKLRALAIREKVLGPEHPETANSLANLARLYERKNLAGKAEPLYRRALAIKEKLFGKKDLALVSLLESLGRLLIKTGRAYTAKSFISRANAIRKNQGPVRDDESSIKGGNR